MISDILRSARRNFFRFYQLARYFINLLAQALLLAFSFLSLAAKKLQRDMLICLLSLVFPQYFSGFIHFRELSKLLNAKWLVTKISTQWKRRRNWSIFSKYATFSPERITLHRFFGTQSRSSSCNMASMLKLEPQFALTGRYGLPMALSVSKMCTLQQSNSLLEIRNRQVHYIYFLQLTSQISSSRWLYRKCD